jgi:16S rRNA (uracil1498-N3)-methyltransferase
MTASTSFYLPPDQWRAPWILKGPEARHMLRVMRLDVGDEARLFDGRGREGLFTIVGVGKDKAELDVLELKEVGAPAVRTTLAAGYAKSARRGWLLEKAVELHAWRVAFWRAERSQGALADAPKDSWMEKCVQAAKQCGNPWLPELDVLPSGVSQLSHYACKFDRVFVLWESASKDNLLLPEDFRSPGEYLLVVGPEGGLSRGEAETLQKAGAEVKSLGGSILRAETAALLALGTAYLGGEAHGPWT